MHLQGFDNCFLLANQHSGVIVFFRITFCSGKTSKDEFKFLYIALNIYIYIYVFSFT